MDKLETITKLFEGSEIRSIWDSQKQEYYFSVVDVIGALANPKEPRKYWNDLKKKLKEEGSELSEKIGQLKMKSKAAKDNIEQNLGHSIITNKNKLSYKYEE